ncbi:MAG: YggS family pyridoxal phosphate-dependent enzyme [Porphyromonas sp.]|nr:YggS family pyridoxal phosphate-dependent enzyme [Porphyromonas sp.]
MSIKDRLQTLQQELPDTTRLIAVSKYHTEAEVMEAYEAGQRLFGENRVQELLPKYEALPKEIEWHLIGTLQRNKVKYVVPFVSMIHSIDSMRLLEEVEKQCARLDRDSLPVLLQLHISGEETKHGFTPEELDEFLQSDLPDRLQHAQISGIMGMAALTDDAALVESQFAQLKQIFDRLKQGRFANNPHFTELSMGMSHDYKIAIQYGATFVRVGSAIFG